MEVGQVLKYEDGLTTKQSSHTPISTRQEQRVTQSVLTKATFRSSKRAAARLRWALMAPTLGSSAHFKAWLWLR
jgi:hypothetical protein